MIYKLIKLRLDIYSHLRSDFSISVVFALLSSRIMSRYNEVAKSVYPCSLGKLMQLVSVEYVYDHYSLGIRQERFRRQDDIDLYQKILDVEYGNNGVECRVLRHVLENFKMGNYYVS